jgi:hypothetical protein
VLFFLGLVLGWGLGLQQIVKKGVAAACWA